MQDRRISYYVANVQAKIFLKAITVVMDVPGVWYAGLAMAQSIFNVCYVGLLDQFQDLLGWKKVNDKVSSCYYQATRLVIFVFYELMGVGLKCKEYTNTWNTTNNKKKQ